MKTKIKAILFDMDGIIIDSEVYWAKLEKKFAEAHGIKFTPAYRRYIMARSEREVAAIFKHEFGFKESEEEIRRERDKIAYNIYHHQAKLMPGFLMLAKKFNQDGFLVALVSSSPYAWINPILRRLHLRPFFKKIVSADDMRDGRAKPDPAIYLFSAKQLKVKPQECLVFEDSINGMRAAKAAGMTCVIIPDRRWVKDRRGAGEANLIATSLKDKRILKMLSRHTISI
ncbi:MAG: HAD family phosphatase [Patescibacteria group bacterium]